ncbi:hypothetical protein [Prevotella sp. HCN-7019]|uniref:hypothetical protein n=1 Tax=Prevotella sp. HCN-7019 TaxID=3134668 RepID=UPI0030C32941
MKTFLCWGISKLEGLASLLVWVVMFTLMAKGEKIGANQQLAVLPLMIAVLGATIPAVFTAIYAVKNFDEVTSYSMLFYLSKSSMLDSKISYFFRTMFMAGFCWAMLIFSIGLFFV